MHDFIMGKGDNWRLHCFMSICLKQCTLALKYVIALRIGRHVQHSVKKFSRVDHCKQEIYSIKDAFNFY